MIKPKEKYFQCLSEEGYHKIFYREWGKKTSKHTVVCVHGLTRLSRDFDALAANLAPDYRVICPDIVGRGKSDWLRHHRHYNFIQYCLDMAALIARLDVEKVHWVGTSLGGLIGMILAAPSNSPLSSLVLNDVGPELKHAELIKMGNYVGKEKYFEDFDALVEYYKTTYADMGAIPDTKWRKLAEYSAVAEGDGYRLHYDPKIGEAFRSSYSFMHFNLWKYWNKITCPTMTFRGSKSNFLSAATAEKMTSKGPGTNLIEIEGVGHAPRLHSKQEIGAIRNFLDKMTASESGKATKKKG